jgi:hypothetical protein
MIAGMVERIELDPATIICRMHYRINTGDLVASPPGFEPARNRPRECSHAVGGCDPCLMIPGPIDPEYQRRRKNRFGSLAKPAGPNCLGWIDERSDRFADPMLVTVSLPRAFQAQIRRTCPIAIVAQ